MRHFIVCIVAIGLACLTPECGCADESQINGVNVSVYEQMLNNKGDRTNRLRAIETLGRYAENPEAYVTAFGEAVSDPDPLIRATALRGIGDIGRRAPALVSDFKEPLAAGLSDPQFRVRAEAVQAVSQFGSAGRLFLEDIRKLQSEDSSSLVRQYTVGTLVAISEGSDDHLPALLAAVRQREVIVQSDWVRDLSRVGRGSQETPQALQSLLDYDWPELPPTATDLVRRQAIYGLGLIGRPAQAAVDQLFAVVDAPFRYADVYASENDRRPRQRREVVSREPDDFWIRLTAYWSIHRIDPPRIDDLVERLEAHFESEQVDERRFACVALSRLAHVEQMRRLLPTVETLAGQDDRTVAALARLAELRLTDARTREMEPALFETVPLPDSDRQPPGAAAMRMQLSEKLAAIKTACMSGDAYLTAATTVSPAEYERALLQGDLKRQFEEDRAFEFFTRELEFEIRQFDAEKRTASVLAREPRGEMQESRGELLHFFWYDGRWYAHD